MQECSSIGLGSSVTKVTKQILLFVLAMAIGFTSARSQTETSKSQDSITKGLNFAQLMPSTPRPTEHMKSQWEEFQSLTANALMHSPQVNFAEDIRDARLPSRSGRVFDSLRIPTNADLNTARSRLHSDLGESPLLRVDVRKLRDGGRVLPANLR
jgi:hypothetical protein